MSFICSNKISKQKKSSYYLVSQSWKRTNHHKSKHFRIWQTRRWHHLQKVRKIMRRREKASFKVSKRWKRLRVKTYSSMRRKKSWLFRLRKKTPNYRKRRLSLKTNLLKHTRHLKRLKSWLESLNALYSSLTTK